MNSIIVLLLLSASVASAQSATSKAADHYCVAGYHPEPMPEDSRWTMCVPDKPATIGRKSTLILSDYGWCYYSNGEFYHAGEGEVCRKTVPPRKAKPKPSVKKKAAPECLGGGCDPGINPPSESSFIHCPETGCPTDLPESIHVIVDPKPQEEPKTSGDAIQLKDDPSKLCDALSPTEKISCLMNIVAPTAPEATSPMPVYVREPVTQVVAHCPEGWHVEVWRPAFNSYGFSIDPPMLLGWDAGYVADNRPIVISMTIDKEHPDRCAVDVK